MREGGGIRIEWGQLALVTALAGLALAYLIDARSVSLSTQNLLLLQPTAIIVLILWAVIAYGCIRRGETDEGPSKADWAGRARVLAMVAAFGAFIFSLERIGYDIAMALFVCAGLWIGGERRPLVLVLFPLIFTAAAILGFRALVPYPFPTTLL
ncbi:tripartite tricarboxylate transporter TctB family protein [Elioraea rosea]|uniref:tripartite tricarboxylate transporter TctB family protein n=1 Tax=Elioraea rosea TaxID=2492390 RepID=UPI0011826ADD|nr:tripartite tricarboxylate transporter TctB family protein [Elioraea rosea]